MTIKVRRFDWDEHNTGHLKQAHPHIDLELLEDTVREAKAYIRGRPDQFGNKVYGV